MDKCPKCGVIENLTNSCICKSCKQQHMKQYYLENKEKFKNNHEKFKKNNPEYSKKYREENREKILKTQNEYVKRIGYKYEKTPSQRKLRAIKRKTRYHFPLSKNIKCELCRGTSECHHHNTRPIEYNKFNILCNKCHKGIHTQLNIITEVQNNGRTNN